MSDTADLSLSASPPDRGGLARRVVSGIGIQALNKLVGVGRVFIIVPFFLLAHGVDGYADWLKLLALAQLISMCALGQGDYYNFLIREAGARQAYAEMNAHLGNAISFHLALIVVFSIVFWSSVYLFDIKLIMSLQYLTSFEAKITLYLLCLFTIG